VPEKQIGKMKIPGFVRWLLGRAPVQAFLKGQIASRVQGPTADQRARDEVYLYGEAWDDAGQKVAMRLRTREPYTLTAEAGVKATLKVIEGRLAPGTYTPSMAFGADFVLALDGVTLSRVAL
jgi:saccharopine dehydrogenase (NAD+, L-lysine-forming)